MVGNVSHLSINTEKWRYECETSHRGLPKTAEAIGAVHGKRV